MKKNINLLSKKTIAATLIGGTVIGGMVFANAQDAYAHGYILNDRAHLAQQNINQAASAAAEPQSVGEYISANFHNGITPLHQAITAHSNTLGLYPEMAEQSEDRWHKMDMQGGENDLTWQITANHRTSYVRYYITKADWDPNQPLTYDSFEYLDTFHNFDGDSWHAPMLPLQNSRVTHTLNLPTDRNGYHVIFAEWHIADTSSSFFKVKDINLINDIEIVAPESPQNLQARDITHEAIELTWSRPSGVVDYYDIYRVGLDEPIGRSTTEKFIDSGLNINTEYTYYVVAVNQAGSSLESERFTVRTADRITPSAPVNLREHNMTADSITLAWNPPSSGADEYVIYRSTHDDMNNYIEIARTTETMHTDTGLMQDLIYHYHVVSVKDGVYSTPSVELVTVIPSELFPPAEHELVDRLPSITSISSTTNSITFDFNRSTSLDTNNGEVMFYRVMVNNMFVEEISTNNMSPITLTSNENITIEENTEYEVQVIAGYVPIVGDTILIEGTPKSITTKDSAFNEIPEFENIAGISYVAGQRVRYIGHIWEARQNFTLNGDPSWAPGQSDALWLLVE